MINKRERANDQFHGRIVNESAREENGELLGWDCDLMIDQFGITSSKSPQYYGTDLVDEVVNGINEAILADDFPVTAKHLPDEVFENGDGNQHPGIEVFVADRERPAERIEKDGRPQIVVHGTLRNNDDGRDIRQIAQLKKRVPISLTMDCRWVKGEVNGFKKNIVQKGTCRPLGIAFVRRGGHASLSVVNESSQKDDPEVKEKDMDLVTLKKEHPGLVHDIEVEKERELNAKFGLEKTGFTNQIATLKKDLENKDTDIAAKTKEITDLKATVSGFEQAKEKAESITKFNAALETELAASAFSALARNALKNAAKELTKDENADPATAFFNVAGFDAGLILAKSVIAGANHAGSVQTGIKPEEKITGKPVEENTTIKLNITEKSTAAQAADLMIG